MNMISLTFFAFAAALFFVLWLCGKTVKSETAYTKLFKTVMLCASYLFVLYADVRFALVLFAMSTVTYLCAKAKNGTKIGVIFALLCLGYFKYTNFFITSFNDILGSEIGTLKVILPLGISFYAFSAISYLVDVKRNKLQPAGFADVALYLSFFPKITSGPVQRGSDFLTQIKSRRNVGWDSFGAG